MAATGRGAQFGSGGTRSTGQVGPSTTRPEIPELGTAPLAAAHAATKKVEHTRAMERNRDIPDRYAAASCSRGSRREITFDTPSPPIETP